MFNTAKNLLISLGMVGAVAVYSHHIHAKSDVQPVTPPDGYVKQGSVNMDGAIVHQYAKPAPPVAVAQSAPANVMGRYIDNLPQDIRQEGEEYETLWKNVQNAELMAYLKQLHAQMAEDDAKRAKFGKAKQQDEDATVTDGQVSTITSVAAEEVVSPVEIEAGADKDEEMQNINELEAIRLHGVLKKSGKYVATITTATGRKVEIRDRGTLIGGVSVKVESDYIILEKGGASRTINVTG